MPVPTTTREPRRVRLVSAGAAPPAMRFSGVFARAAAVARAAVPLAAVLAFPAAVPRAAVSTSAAVAPAGSLGRGLQAVQRRSNRLRIARQDRQAFLAREPRQGDVAAGIGGELRRPRRIGSQFDEKVGKVTAHWPLASESKSRGCYSVRPTLARSFANLGSRRTGSNRGSLLMSATTGSATARARSSHSNVWSASPRPA